MPQGSSNSKLIVSIVAVAVVLALAAVVVAVVISQDGQVSVVSGNGEGSSVGDNSATSGSAGNVGGAGSAGSAGGSQVSRATAGNTASGGTARGSDGSVTRSAVGGHTASAGGAAAYVPGSVDISSSLPVGQQQVPPDFRPSPIVAKALIIKEHLGGIKLDDKSKEMLRQHEFMYDAETAQRLQQSVQELNAAFEAKLASEKPNAPITTEQGRLQLVQKFNEHLGDLKDVNDEYRQKVYQELDSDRDRANLLHAFDVMLNKEVAVPYSVQGTGKTAVVLKGTMSRTHFEVVDGDAVYKYRVDDVLGIVPDLPPQE